MTTNVLATLLIVCSATLLLVSVLLMNSARQVRELEVSLFAARNAVHDGPLRHVTVGSDYARFAFNPRLVVFAEPSRLSPGKTSAMLNGHGQVLMNVSYNDFVRMVNG